MPSTVNDTPSINANFAATVINRAAEIFADTATGPGQECYVVDALYQARDEFMAAETRKQRNSRTYGFPHLLRDLRQYTTSRYPEYADSFSPITEWSGETAPASVVETLREAALNVSMIVEERTRTASKLDAMSDKELREYDLMRKVVDFLTRHGLSVGVEWDRENPNAPIDYWATIDGIRWAFELTELRLDPKENYYRKVGHPNEKRSIDEQLEALEMPLPQIPDGPDAVQSALNDAVKHGSKEGKLKGLNGARYCLVLHNRQFLYAPDWEAIAMPDFSAFDAVLMLHQDSVAAAQTWEALTQDGFNKPLLSQNVSDLSDIASFRLSRRPGINPEVIRSFWKRMEESGITDAEIYEALKETRADRCRRPG